MLSNSFLVSSTLISVLFSCFIGYYVRCNNLRTIPAASPLATISGFWLFYQSRKGRRYLKVHEAHERLGTFVRLQQNHVSIASFEAISIIYGQGHGFLKSNFYDAFVTGNSNLFNTRSKAVHARKRKIVSHAFSTKSIIQFEQHLHANINKLVHQWDSLCFEDKEYRPVDCLKWFNYLAFDIMADLTFGAPFGMLNGGGSDNVEILKHKHAKPTVVRAIESFNERGAAFAALGCLPFFRKFAPLSPDYLLRNGVRAGKEVVGIGALRVHQRLHSSPEERQARDDILARLMDGKDEFDQPLSEEELIVETMTELVGGSDAVGSTLCLLMYRILKTPGVFAKLRAEIDSIAPSLETSMSYDSLKRLRYLRAVINESLRIHPTNSLGLPRVVPNNGSGVSIGGHFFPPGTVLSVPTWTIHHQKEIWGDDVEEFIPERWAVLTEVQKASFLAWGTGSRQCIGRTLAEMEVMLVIATIIHKYDMELYENELETVEGFLNKPLRCNIGIRQRQK